MFVPLLVAVTTLSAIFFPQRDALAPLFREIQAAANGHTEESPKARAAWEKIVAIGPAALPRVLEAMDQPDPVVANWLRTAFDRIVEEEMRHETRRIDPQPLQKFATNPRRHGPARRLALELVDRLRPGTSRLLIAGWLDDPEFRYDAVDLVAREGEELDRAGAKDKAMSAFQRAFQATDDVTQAQRLAHHLKQLGVSVDLASHFGFLTDWYVIGPFDGKQQRGFRAVYPPEQQVDLKAKLPGKTGLVRWRRYHAAVAWEGLPARVALVNLLEPLGQAEDAVAYAYTAVTLSESREVEFRGAADDNFTIWVNGKREFGFEEYRNGVRLDRHRFRARLKAGENAILVKVCQAPLDPANPAPNWEFLLRVTEPGGKGLPLRSALPVEKLQPGGKLP
jgi:hypothetical protein